MYVTARQVEWVLSALEVAIATLPDDISPGLLKHCAKELSGPLSGLHVLSEGVQMALNVGAHGFCPQEKFKMSPSTMGLYPYSL